MPAALVSVDCRQNGTIVALNISVSFMLDPTMNWLPHLSLLSDLH